MRACQPAAQHRGNASFRLHHCFHSALTDTQIRSDHGSIYLAIMVSLPLSRHVSVLPGQHPNTKLNARNIPCVLHARGRRGAFTAIRCSNRAAQESDLVPLGRTDLKVSALGIGTLQWGDPDSGFGNRYTAKDLSAAYSTLIEGGVNFFDTAEVYGYQNIQAGEGAEQLLGRFSASTPSTTGVPPVVATKFFTIPWTRFLIGGGWRLGVSSMVPALQESLKRMGREEIDLWQIHFPFPIFSTPTLMDGLKEARDLGLTRAVGVSNFSKQQMEEAHGLLSKSGIPLASNQVKYSLLCQDAEKNGILESAKDRGISVIAYSPLATGLLTDKALDRNDNQAIKVQPLLKVMASIGTLHGKSVTQVALNYLICKGAIPIAGCKSEAQARSHVGVLGWRLSAEEVSTLDEKAASIR